MHYFKYTVVALGCVVCSYALANNSQDPSVHQQAHQIAVEINQTTDAQVEAQLDNAQALLDGAEAPLNEAQLGLDETTLSPDFDVLTDANTGNDQSVLWQALQDATGKMDLQSMRNQTKYPQDMYIYLLLSMSVPADNIRAMMYDMAFAYPEKQIVLVFQGALNNDVTAMVKYLYDFMPPDMSIPIVIDPNIFNAFEPPGVPYYAIQVEPDDWRQVVGNVPISQAIQYAENEGYDGTPVGRIYPIVEPNMLEEIYSAIKEIDWDEMRDNTVKKLKDKQPARVDLPNATLTYSYLVDVSVVIEQDIVTHDDQIIIAQGEVINPLKYLPLTRRYIFIDATDETQIEILRFWRERHPMATAIATHLPDADTRKVLHEEFGEIYQLDPLLAERFGLEKVPSIAYQHGEHLAVDVINPQDFIDAQEIKIQRTGDADE